MSIDIQDECHSCMFQVLRHCLDIIAVLQAERCITMIQIMKPDTPKPHAFKDLLQLIIVWHTAKMIPRLIGKHKIRFIAKYFSCLQIPLPC